MNKVEKLKKAIEGFELVGGMEEDIAKARKKLEALEAGKPVTEAPVPVKEAEVVTPVVEGEGELVEDFITDVARFKEAGRYEIHAEGNFRTKLVSSFEPNTEKPQRWFVMETADDRLKKPNRGVYVGEYGRGSGIYRGILDGLGVPYTFDESSGKLSYKLSYPILCWADWSRDAKGIGGVRISNIRQGKPEQAL